MQELGAQMYELIFAHGTRKGTGSLVPANTLSPPPGHDRGESHLYTMR